MPSAAPSLFDAVRPFAAVPDAPEDVRAWPLLPPVALIEESIARLEPDPATAHDTIAALRVFARISVGPTPSAVDRGLERLLGAPDGTASRRADDQVRVVAWVSAHAAARSNWSDALRVVGRCALAASVPVLEEITPISHLFRAGSVAPPMRSSDITATDRWLHTLIASAPHARPEDALWRFVFVSALLALGPRLAPACGPAALAGLDLFARAASVPEAESPAERCLAAARAVAEHAWLRHETAVRPAPPSHRRM